MLGQDTKKIMLIGGAGSGKERLVKIFFGSEFVLKRVMAVQYLEPLVVTPDEFLENRRFYPALIATSQSCDVLLMLQSAFAKRSVFPPCFATIFKRRVLGIITHADGNQGNVHRAQKFLYTAGAKELLVLAEEDSAALEALQQNLK